MAVRSVLTLVRVPAGKPPTKFTDRDWKRLLKAVEDEYRFLVDLAYWYAEKRD